LRLGQQVPSLTVGPLPTRAGRFFIDRVVRRMRRSRGVLCGSYEWLGGSELLPHNMTMGTS